MHVVRNQDHEFQDLLGKFPAFVALGEAAHSQWVVMPTRACVFTSGEQLQSQHNPSGRSPVPSSLLHPQPLAAQSLTCRAWRCCRQRCGRRCRGVPWALRRRTRCAVPAGRPPAAWGVRGRRFQGQPPSCLTPSLCWGSPHTQAPPCSVWLWPNTLLAFP